MFSRASKLMTGPSTRLSQVTSHIQSRNMASVTQVKLNTGASIPAIGFGTWQDKDAQEDAVLEALKAG